MQADAHPDRHGHRSVAEQQEISDRASEITDAYAVIKAPHRRATHLLELLGAPITEEDGGSLLGPGFLMEVMEIREQLEDAGDDVDCLQKLRGRNQNSVEILLEDLRTAFDVTGDVDEARLLTARLQYLQKIEEEIHARMPVM